MPSYTPEPFFSARGIIFITAGTALTFILLVSYIWYEESTKKPMTAYERDARMQITTTRPPINAHPIDQNNSVSLDGFKYTVERVYHKSKIGFATAEHRTSYLVVDLEVENQTPRTTDCYTEFHILSENGFRYDEDTGATWNTRNGHLFGVKILPEFSKPITVVFLVPTEALRQPLILDIERRSASGMIKIGSAIGDLAND